MTRILLFGTGSVGTVYGMLFHKGGADVTCICRSNHAIANSDGLTIRSTIFGEQTFRPSIAKSVQEACEASSSSFDFVVVCTKAVSGQDVQFWQSAIGPAIQSENTSIVIIQNGLGVENIFHDAFPDNTIISGVTYLPTSQISPNTFLHTETQKLHLGLFPAKTATEKQRKSTEEFAAIIRAAGADATVHADVQIERWKKLIGNATWNPICALSRCRDLQFLQASPALAQDFVAASMREVVAVATALGYGEVITEKAVAVQMERSKIRKWPGVAPSMMTDVLSRKSIEVEAVIGKVVKVAKKEGVDVPRLETLYLLLKAYEYQAAQT